MNRIGYLLPSSRWQMTVRMYTIMKDGGYFPEVRSSFINMLTGFDKYNKDYEKDVSLLPTEII